MCILSNTTVDHYIYSGMSVLEEVRCPYSCFYESIRMPSGQLLNETYGCNDRCETSFSSTDRCRQVTYHVNVIIGFSDPPCKHSNFEIAETNNFESFWYEKLANFKFVTRSLVPLQCISTVVTMLLSCSVQRWK